MISTSTNFDDFVNDKVTEVKKMGKNLQSIQTDAREGELLAELEDLDWDIVFLSETWRSERQERWKTEEGHIFCGSGGTEGSKGVALLLHRKWTRGFKAFAAISDRLCTVDRKIAGHLCRLISVYFPHGGQDDEAVEGLYSELDKAIDGARRQNRTCIVVGDWNAVVGTRQEGDAQDCVGIHGVGRRNDRGQWLAQWAGAQRLTIANTYVTKSFEDQWTYIHNSIKRQIDFALICTSKAIWIEDAGANEALGVGKDHRTVYLDLKLPEHSVYSRKSKNKQVRNLKGWQAKDKEKYKSEVKVKLQSIRSDASVPEKYKEVEEALLDAGKKWASRGKAKKEKSTEAKKQLRELIEKRREARRRGVTEDVKRYSKLVQKEMRAVVRATKTFKVCQLLEEFKDMGQIKDLKKKGKRECINTVINNKGEEVSDVQDIAEAFADFYEALYKESEDNVHDYKLDAEVAEVPPVQPAEVRAQLKNMKKGKAADEAGIVSELLCEASDELIETIADIFTSILKPGEALPPAWKFSSIRVLLKKGDPKLPENYRPVCIIPILYKVFSKVISERIKEKLLEEQSWDQAGFRPGFSCDDHLFTISMLVEKSNEFNLPLWTAAIDFKKAFDSISHRSIFKALQEQGVPMPYLDVLARLYKEQQARIGGEHQSRDFPITKGTKQGDPISPLIFNAVLEAIMRQVKEKWKRRKYGVNLEPSFEDRLTNLRFADDILVIARTLPQIKQMLLDIIEECEKNGLKLHPEKTKIMHNDKGYGRHVTAAKVGEMSIEVLHATDSTMYLGRLLSLTEPHETELQHRTKKAWAKFGAYREELINKDVPLSLRLKLFNSVVSPTMLYGCASWVLTAARKQKLQATQMRMMRTIMGGRRHIDAETGEHETWIAWIKRATMEARSKMKENNIRDWLQVVTTTQERWHVKLKGQDPRKWSTQVVEWRPIGFRSVGRPSKRWSQEDDTDGPNVAERSPKEAKKIRQR